MSLQPLDNHPQVVAPAATSMDVTYYYSQLPLPHDKDAIAEALKGHVWGLTLWYGFCNLCANLWAAPFIGASSPNQKRNPVGLIPWLGNQLRAIVEIIKAVLSLISLPLVPLFFGGVLAVVEPIVILALVGWLLYLAVVWVAWGIYRAGSWVFGLCRRKKMSLMYEGQSHVVVETGGMKKKRKYPKRGYSSVKGMKKVVEFYPGNKPDPERNPDGERWFFINGIGTNKASLITTLQQLDRLFNRRFIGIHNATWGVVYDLVECMLQRDLFWRTKDDVDGYNSLVSLVIDPTVTKIVLMAHSQGGIILSTWVDRLLADFPAATLSKVEIYTFASAAKHFSNPNRAHEEDHPPHLAFGHVEHFLNEVDFVARIGLLSAANLLKGPSADVKTTATDPPVQLKCRVAGKIFKRFEKKGHGLVTNYLEAKDLPVGGYDPANRDPLEQVLYPESFLLHPVVQEHSHLITYIPKAPDDGLA
ncbi:hypothetical protein IAT38_004862 [Cryptococcus sp. DSM 104549]